MDGSRKELQTVTDSNLSQKIIGINEIDALASFRGALVAANAGIEDILAAVEHSILVAETVKKIPDYNIEGVCQIAYQVSHLKQTYYDIRMDD